MESASKNEPPDLRPSALIRRGQRVSSGVRPPTPRGESGYAAATTAARLLFAITEERHVTVGGPGFLAVEYAAAAERTVVHVVGEVDVATADAVRTAGIEAVGKAERHVEVDVRGVSFMDSTGLAALLALFKEATRRSLTFSVLCGPGETPVYKLVRLVGLDDALGLRRAEST